MVNNMVNFESLIRKWGGETVVIHFDQPTGAWIIIAIHSTRLGPATGGTRMNQYASPGAALDDALKLATGMTYKFAVPGFKHGGGKAVIAVPGIMDPQSRSDLLRRYGKVVNQLGGLFLTGPDVGTSSEDMDIISETGAPFIFARTQASGGAGSSGPFTALGVFTGIQVAYEHLLGRPSLEGCRVLVQGVGSVGKTLIDFLTAAGAEVLFSEVDEGAIRHYRDNLGYRFIPPESVYSTECDIFAPCALGGMLSEQTIPQLKCLAIAGGANNQLASSLDAERLQARGILYAPDYVVNVGGAMGITGIEVLGWSREEAKRQVTGGVRKALKRIFQLSEMEGITTDAAAFRIAEEHLTAAV